MYFARALERSTLGDMSGRPDVVLAELPPGPGGAAQTLRYMRGFVHHAIRNPDQLIRLKALDIVSTLPPRQWMAEINALHAFVRDSIRYVKDPGGESPVELVQTPEKTLEIGQGDCDDKATLLAALLTAIGHPARFIAVGFDNEPLSHVLVQTRVNDKWIGLETIIDKPVGWFPPGVTSSYILKV